MQQEPGRERGRQAARPTARARQGREGKGREQEAGGGLLNFALAHERGGRAGWRPMSCGAIYGASMTPPSKGPEFLSSRAPSNAHF